MINKRLPFRSYEVSIPDGTIRRRNSKHVRISNEPPTIWTPDVDEARSHTSETIAARHVDTPTPENNIQPSGVINQQPSTRTADTHPVTLAKTSKLPIPVRRAITTRSGRVVKPPARFSE